MTLLPSGTEPPQSWWKRRVVTPLVQQLTQGVRPAQLAFALALGGVLAVNPFLGTTTAACIAAGVLFRLNQPVLQLANVIGAPFQLALIIPWVRCGEWLYRAAPMPLTPSGLLEEFQASPLEFFQHFGLTGLHAASAWLLVAPLLGLVLYLVLLPVLKLLARRFNAA